MSLGDISVAKWNDKRNVCVISNAHVPTMMDSVNRQGNSKRKPNIVHINNNHLLGINRSDQMLLYHSALRKTIRGYKKVGIHIMEIFFSNSYYMYAKSTAIPIAKNMKDCRESMVTNLIGAPSPNRHLKPQTSFHHLSTMPPTEKKKKMVPEHANTVLKTKSVENRGMSVCSVPINQRCALIRAFTCHHNLAVF